MMVWLSVIEEVGVVIVGIMIRDRVFESGVIGKRVGLVGI